jgi:glycosyltransferase involved in cell wall biosynthesis
VHVLRHPVNLGQGAALQTALEYSRSISGVSLFATMDSDGQHCEADLVPMIRCLYEGKLDIVFGNRFSANRAAGMPRSRRVILRCAAQFERILTGLDLGDAHNGFRVLNRFAAEQIELRQNRMAHATQFKQLVRKYRLKYGEVPVTIRYNTETLTKGQKNSGAFIILKDLVQAYLFDR